MARAPAAVVPVHRHLRAARYAAVRRTVQLLRTARQAAIKLRLVLAVPAHRLSGSRTVSGVAGNFRQGCVNL